MSRDTNLSKTFQGVRKKLFTEPYWGYLRKQYCSNLIVSRSESIENVCKYNANQTIFDKDWLDWSKWTIWVNPDAVFLRAFKTQESYDCSMKIDKVYLKGQYGSNCIVRRYKFIKNIPRSQKKAFYGTLSRILERTILFRSYCIPILIYWKCLQIQSKSNHFW